MESDAGSDRRMNPVIAKVYIGRSDRKGTAILVEEHDLILCRDCRYWAQSFPYDLCKREEVPLVMEDTDYCSRGDRRDACYTTTA